MRILVTGGQHYADREFLFATLDRVHVKRGITLLIEGGATGADRLAREWAFANNVPVATFKADWTTYGKRAGPLRNQQMLSEGKPDGAVAFPGGRGTADMIRQIRAAGLKVWQPQSQSAPTPPASPC